MSMKYIRDTYGVPAKRGRKILFEGRVCTIRGSSDARLRVTDDRANGKMILHPTWRVQYLPEDTKA